MDAFDKKILNILQHDCTASVSDVASQVGLSTTPCWRRIQAMEKSGIKRLKKVTKLPSLITPANLALITFN